MKITRNEFRERNLSIGGDGTILDESGNEYRAENGESVQLDNPFKTREDIEKCLSEIENEDETIAMLEKAMQFYCGTWDKCEGYKEAIKITLQDQYDNHPQEQDPEDLDKLWDILNGAI